MEEQKLGCIEQVWVEPGWSHVRFRTQFDRRRNDPNCHVVLTYAQLQLSKKNISFRHSESMLSLLFPFTNKI